MSKELRALVTQVTLLTLTFGGLAIMCFVNYARGGSGANTIFFLGCLCLLIAVADSSVMIVNYFQHRKVTNHVR